MISLSRARRVIGLDPGNSTIKAVQVLVRKNKPPVLEWALVQRWSGDSDVYPEIMNKTALSKGALAVVALHNIQAIYRIIETPEMEPLELESAIKYEEEVYIPFSPEDRVSDYRIVLHEGGRYVIALAGAKKSSVVEAVKPILDAGIQLLSAEISGLALANLFSFMYKNTSLNDETVILLDIGCKTTIFVLVNKGLPIIIREISLGGELFTEQIEDSFQITREEAEMVKCMPAERQKQIRRVLEPLFYRLVEEIQVSMEYNGGVNIGRLSRIFLSGGGARCPGLKDYIVENLGVEVQPWEIISAFDIGGSISKELIASWTDVLPICLGVVLGW